MYIWQTSESVNGIKLWPNKARHFAAYGERRPLHQHIVGSDNGSDELVLVTVSLTSIMEFFVIHILQTTTNPIMYKPIKLDDINQAGPVQLALSSSHHVKAYLLV